MTGELFSLLKEHSILADLLKGEVAVNDAFRERRAAPSSTRLFPLTFFRPRSCAAGQAKKEDAASWTSGLLIGVGCAHRPFNTNGAEFT